MVRGTESAPADLGGGHLDPRQDPRQRYRDKLARIALDSMVQLVGLLDASGTVLEVNKVALDAVGLKLSDVEGRPFWTTLWWQVSDEVNQTLRDSIARAARGESVRWDTPIYGRAGGAETIIIDASLQPVMDDDGNVMFICAEGRDITQRVARERELVRSHLELQDARREIERQRHVLHSLFMQAPTLIAVLRGPDHVVEFANPPICQAWGHAEADVLDRPLFDALPELQDEYYSALLGRVYSLGIPYVGKEVAANFDRAGTVETRYFDFMYSPFRNAEGEIEGVFVIASDVTQQKLAREQLDSLRSAAETANRAKDEFLAMLGHELRNPLSPILTALQLMKLQGESGSERERTVIERQVSHLTRLVDDLLDVARIARGRVELKPELVELSDIVAKAIEIASPLLEQRNHALTVDVPRRGLRVEVDSMRLGQVVSNLLTNAAKYTPPGGQIAVRGRRDNHEVVLSVRDTGIGIAPEMLPRIFELFVQEGQALDRAQGGLGIGLTIVRSLVERHGGSVAAHSDGPGTGSEIVVRLPAAPALASAEPVAAPGPAPAAAGSPATAARILVVDDNEDGAEMLAAVLAGKGYDTRVAHDAPTALRVAAEFSPDIAFLDIGLPVMDGYELASHLRELPGLAGVRLIALTGYGQESDRRRTRAAGFHHHLVKPVDIAAIEATLRARGAPE